MNNDINAVLFYLCGKNYFNGNTEIRNVLDNNIDLQHALDEIEALGLLHTKTDTHTSKVYLLKQFAKDGIHNLPQAYSQDPYSFFKQLHLEKQKILIQQNESVGNSAKNATGNKEKSRNKIVGLVIGVIATTITFLKLKGRK